MLRGIDISNWQLGLDTSAMYPQIDFVICKATEGTYYVDATCDGFVQAAIAMGKPFGFYHFAADGNATEEADFFIANCEGYFGSGIPVLDWEGQQSVAWVNEFVNRVHDVKGVWPWIYGNPWRFDQGGVEPNCMRWVASYPSVTSPTFAMAEGWDCPEADGFVGAWQFCSDGVLNGYAGYLDFDLFYGTREAWDKYAASYNMGSGTDSGVPGDNAAGVSVLENDDYRVTVERK